ALRRRSGRAQGPSRLGRLRHRPARSATCEAGTSGDGSSARAGRDTAEVAANLLRSGPNACQNRARTQGGPMHIHGTDVVLFLHIAVAIFTFGVAGVLLTCLQQMRQADSMAALRS